MLVFSIYTATTHMHITTAANTLPITHITLERLLSGVGPHVLIQASLLAEGLVALAALVRLLLP